MNKITDLNKFLNDCRQVARSAIHAARIGDIIAIQRLSDRYGPGVFSPVEDFGNIVGIDTRNDLTQIEMTGTRPLLAAMHAGQSEMVRFLLDSGAYPRDFFKFIHPQLAPLFDPNLPETQRPPVPEKIHQAMKLVYDHCLKVSGVRNPEKATDRKVNPTDELQ